MKITRIFLIIVLMTPLLQGCAELMSITKQVTQEPGDKNPLTGNEVIEGLTGISFSDGWAILKGSNPEAETKSTGFDSTAATGYLRSTTYSQLSTAFSPKVNASLDKKLVGNYSPNQIWNTLTSSYNAVAKNSLGMIEPVKTNNLGAYVTEKALDGLFYKISIQEKHIRKDPMKWAKTGVGNILQRVFGKS